MTVLLIAITIGIPVSYSIAISSVCYLFFESTLPLLVIAQRMVVGVDSFWQYIATGIIIVIAACFEIIQNKISSIKVSRSKLSKA